MTPAQLRAHNILTAFFNDEIDEEEALNFLAEEINRENDPVFHAAISQVIGMPEELPPEDTEAAASWENSYRRGRSWR